MFRSRYILSQSWTYELSYAFVSLETRSVLDFWNFFLPLLHQPRNELLPNLIIQLDSSLRQALKSKGEKTRSCISIIIFFSYILHVLVQPSIRITPFNVTKLDQFHKCYIFNNTYVWKTTGINLRRWSNFFELIHPKAYNIFFPPILAIILRVLKRKRVLWIWLWVGYLMSKKEK